MQDSAWLKRQLSGRELQALPLFCGPCINYRISEEILLGSQAAIFCFETSFRPYGYTMQVYTTLTRMVYSQTASWLAPFVFFCCQLWFAIMMATTIMVALWSSMLVLLLSMVVLVPFIPVALTGCVQFAAHADWTWPSWTCVMTVMEPQAWVHLSYQWSPKPELKIMPVKSCSQLAIKPEAFTPALHTQPLVCIESAAFLPISKYVDEAKMASGVLDLIIKRSMDTKLATKSPAAYMVDTEVASNAAVILTSAGKPSFAVKYNWYDICTSC